MFLLFLFSPFMKLNLLFTLLFLPILGFSQDASWFSDITPETGLTGQKMQKAYSVDVNNDGFIDLITITGVDYFNNRKPMKLFMNETDPKTGSRAFVDKSNWSKLTAM